MTDKVKNIPFSKPDITKHDIKSVQDVIESGWLAHGKYSEKLEKLFCEYTGAKYSTTVSNCTAGLHLSCIAAGFKMGDEVIVPAQTHTATAHAIEYTGATAIFVDVDPLTANIIPDEIVKKITPRTKGVIPVHMAGLPCDMKSIIKICEENNLILIEDCAHSIGTYYDGKHAGNFGITGNFSFYPTKQITTGEGGIVISNKLEIIEKIKKYKAFGIDTPPELRKKPGVYDVQGLGYNYRMTDFQAALGAGQMQRYDQNVARRRENAMLYSNLLKNIQNLKFTNFSKENSYFLFQVLIDPKIKRDRILFGLKEKGIGVSIHYATPVPNMSYYKNKYGYQETDFPNSQNYGNCSISLPVHPGLSSNDIKFICKTLISLVED